MTDRYDTLVVGAGFAGADHGRAPRQPAAASACSSSTAATTSPATRTTTWTSTACSSTSYGPHIFHTNSEKVVEYLSRFTDWRPYEHRVLAERRRQAAADADQPHDDQRALRPGPATDERGRGLLRGARASRRRRFRRPPRTPSWRRSAATSTRSSSAATRASSGSATPRELHASVCARIPIRTNTDDRYFTDAFQKMPADGYTAMFERMLDHPDIDVAAATRTSTTSATRSSTTHLVYTGPIDALLRLPLRPAALPLAGVRAAQRADARRRPAPARRLGQRAERRTCPYTRITEYRHLTGPGRTTRRRSPSSTRAPRATPTTRSPATRPASSTSRYEALAASCRTSRSSAASPATSTSTWTRSWRRRCSTFERMVDEGRVAAAV